MADKPKRASEYESEQVELVRAKQNLEQALGLSEPERASLIDALAGSIVGTERAQVVETWRVEILRRVEEVRAGEVELESWDDVRRAGREALPR